MRNGLTLVEIVVVIAIIAVLAAILMPAIGVVRRNAARAEARQSLRHVQMGLIAYRDEEGRQRLPAATADGRLPLAVLELLEARRLASLPRRRHDGTVLLDPWNAPFRYRTFREAAWWPTAPLEEADAAGNRPLAGSVENLRTWNWSWDEARSTAAWNATWRLYGAETARGSFPFLWSLGGRADAEPLDATAWLIP